MEYMAVIGGLLLISGLMAWARSCEKRAYNGGSCTGCGQLWRQFDGDSQGGRGYTCDGCKKGVWVSYWGIDG